MNQREECTLLFRSFSLMATPRRQFPRWDRPPVLVFFLHFRRKKESRFRFDRQGSFFRSYLVSLRAFAGRDLATLGLDWIR